MSNIITRWRARLAVFITVITVALGFAIGAPVAQASSSAVTWSSCSQAVSSVPGRKFVCIDLVVSGTPYGAKAYVYTGGTSPSQSGDATINKYLAAPTYWTNYKGNSYWYKGDGDWYSQAGDVTTILGNGGAGPNIWWTVDYYSDYDINIPNVYFHDVLEWYANSPGYDLVIILK